MHRKRQKKTIVKGKSKLELKKELKEEEQKHKTGTLVEKEKEEIGTVS